MDLLVFAVVFISVILAAFVLAIWAVVGEERRTQAAWPVRASVPVAAAREQAEPAALKPVAAVASVPVAHASSTAFVPTP